MDLLFGVSGAAGVGEHSATTAATTIDGRPACRSATTHAPRSRRTAAPRRRRPPPSPPARSAKAAPPRRHDQHRGDEERADHLERHRDEERQRQRQDQPLAPRIDPRRGRVQILARASRAAAAASARRAARRSLRPLPPDHREVGRARPRGCRRRDSRSGRPAPARKLSATSPAERCMGA